MKVFVDSDAFVGLAKEDDPHHQRALRLLDFSSKQNVLFFTSNYVFSESITVISVRESHAAAVHFIEQLTTLTNIFTMQRIDTDLEKDAIEIFKKQTSKNTSFVDCTNMAIMKQTRTDAIFSFDQVYRKQGFLLLEDLVKTKN